jgi:MFS transporter, OPA family, sugar phosphate sensor protein UhpC
MILLFTSPASGRAGAECVAPTCAGTSNGFLGTAAYTGAALAGLPLTLIVRRFGWNSFFAVLVVCCAATIALIVPLVHARSWEQKNPEQDGAISVGNETAEDQETVLREKMAK